MIYLNWNLVWRFSTYGVFEMIELDIREAPEKDFVVLFAAMKAANLFKASIGYLAWKITEHKTEEQFGNLDLASIHAQDYREVPRSSMEEMISFPGLLYPTEGNENAYLDEASEKMKATVKIHVLARSVLYQITQPKNSAGSMKIWDFFYHWIAVDFEANRVHLILIGNN